MMTIPAFPPPINNNASENRKKTYAKKAFKRREYLERLGWSRLSKENEKGDLRFCVNHGLEEITKYVPVQFFDGTSESIRYTFMAPIQAGKKSFIGSPPVKLSRGTGTDRSIARTEQTMVDEGGERAVYYDAAMQRQHEALVLSLVNSNVRNMCGIDTNDNNNNNYYETPTKEDRNKKI